MKVRKQRSTGCSRVWTALDNVTHGMNSNCTGNSSHSCTAVVKKENDAQISSWNKICDCLNFYDIEIKNILVGELCYIFLYIEIVIVVLNSDNFDSLFCMVKKSDLLIFNLYFFEFFTQIRLIIMYMYEKTVVIE